MNTHSNPSIRSVIWPHGPGQYLLGSISREEVMTYNTPGKPWTILDREQTSTRIKTAKSGGMK